MNCRILLLLLFICVVPFWVSSQVTIPIGGASAPTCTVAERDARTGACASLPNPFDETAFVYISNPNADGNCASAAGADGNPDALCLWDDVNNVWMTIARSGGGAHTHPPADVDYLHRTSNGKLIYDEDAGDDWDDEENEISENEYDVVIDMSDTTKYADGQAVLRAIHKAVDPYFKPSQTDTNRVIRVVGERTILHTDCQLYADDSERMCLYIGPTLGLDAEGDPIPDCTRNHSSGYLHLVWGDGAKITYRADGNDGAIDGDEQDVMTTVLSYGSGPLCGFRNSDSTVATTYGNTSGWLKLRGHLTLTQGGAAFDTGWTTGRIPAPYVAGAYGAASTTIMVRASESAFHSTDLDMHINCGGDKDNIGVWDFNGWRHYFGRYVFGGCGTDILTTGIGGPSYWQRGTYLGAMVNGSASVAFGNEYGMQAIVNPNCIREQLNSECTTNRTPHECCTGTGTGSCIEAAGNCDSYRPTNVAAQHIANFAGAIVEGSSPLLVATGATGLNLCPTYFEGLNSSTPLAYHGYVMLGAGFRSDNKVPCTKDPDGGGAVTCDAPEDIVGDITEQYTEGITFCGDIGAQIGIGPGADNGSDEEPGLTIHGTNVVQDLKLACDGVDSPDICCNGVDLEDSPGACGNGFVAHSTANITVDISQMTDRNDGSTEPNSYAGRFIWPNTYRFGRGPLGFPTWDDSPYGVTIDDGAGITLTHVPAVGATDPDVYKLDIVPSELGAASWGNESLGYWSFAGPGTDPLMDWVTTDDWIIWTNLDGWNFGGAIIQSGATTSETCDSGEYWIGRTGSGYGACSNGSFYPFSSSSTLVALDLGSNGDDSTGITRILTSNDRVSSPIFSESPADQLLVNLGRSWPGGAACLDQDNDGTCELRVVTVAEGICTSGDVPCVCNTDDASSTPRACLNASGKLLPRPQKTVCQTFVSPLLDDADTPMLGFVRNASTVVGWRCLSDASSTIRVQECNSAGGSCTDLDGATDTTCDLTCSGGNCADDGTIADTALAASSWLRVDNQTMGAATYLSVCVDYTVN